MLELRGVDLLRRTELVVDHGRPTQCGDRSVSQAPGHATAEVGEACEPLGVALDLADCWPPLRGVGAKTGSLVVMTGELGDEDGGVDQRAVGALTEVWGPWHGRRRR